MVNHLIVFVIMWYVYIVKSIRFRYKYIGSTNDLHARVQEHNSGVCRASKPYRPFELMAYLAVGSKARAIKLEQYLKSGSGNAFLKKRLL